ncbi:MAG: phenylacetate-CoA oxygenase subunit PaaJ [Bacteroidetes bacterium 43-93]|nr:phenylacetate-CoA oxygenase subunit PaaJ [Bacteroidota bacterium]OJX00454.1 MAG: phenylacetate-CoA oxygenase subunit PaaJ [Bacteroidetes bacterium 43-93]
MVTETHTKEEILALLQEIKDPEIPVLSIQDIGMLRDVHITNNGYEVILTPTYTGCPAMGIIEADIKALLETKGISPVKVSLIYSPAWTTDWMTEEAKLKMQRYGIAPPEHSSCGNIAIAEMHVPCPYCGSKHTELISRFGATACKSLYKCEDCKEPFEYFKCH